MTFFQVATDTNSSTEKNINSFIEIKSSSFEKVLQQGKCLISCGGDLKNKNKIEKLIESSLLVDKNLPFPHLN